MAIATEFPGIEVVVLVKGEKAQEYKHDNGDVDNINRYIASIDDAEFSIRILISEDYKFIPRIHDALGIKVFVDGVYRCSTLWDMNRPIEYMLLRGSRIQKKSGGTAVKPFKFTTINIIDGEDRELAALHREKTKDTGKIVIEVARVKVNNAGEGLAKGGGKKLETSLEELLLKADAGRKLTHGTGFGKEVAVSDNAKHFSCTPIDIARGPIARFIFYYRAKDVLEDELRVSKVEESLPPLLRYDDEEDLFMRQNEAEKAPMIKTEVDPSEDIFGGDIYGASPHRQFQGPPPAQASIDHNTILQTLLQTHTSEQRAMLVDQLTGGGNAQNAQAAGASADVPIKQENQANSDRKANLSIAVPNRTTYPERQREDGGALIDLNTPVEEAFIKLDPDANVQTSANDQDVVMDGQAEADITRTLSSSTISCASVVEDNAEASTRPAPSTEVDATLGMRHGSMSTADGITTPKTPVQEPALERANEAHIYAADNTGMNIGKPMTPEGIALSSEADIMAMDVEKVLVPKKNSVSAQGDIIALIEADDRPSSVSETVRQRDRSPSDVSIDFNKALQRARSSRPTVTSIRETAQDPSAAMSPTPQPDTNGINTTLSFTIASSESDTREASMSTEADIVQTVDVDMDTGCDMRKEFVEDDEDGSPSRRLIGDSQNSGGFEIIETPTETSERVESATDGEIVEKPVKTFEQATAEAAARRAKKAAEQAEHTKSHTAVQLVHKPTAGFEEAMLAASSPAKKVSKTPERATTPFPAVEAEIEEFHTGDHGFIDIEEIIPQTPVKHHTPATPHGLTKNAMITTLTPIKATQPSTFDRVLSASRKDMADLDPNINTPRKRLFDTRTPGSKAGSVGSPITGNAGNAGFGKKATPIKRERDDDENVVEVDGTPSKKMKYLSLGSQEAPISFDSDDE